MNAKTKKSKEVWDEYIEELRSTGIVIETEEQRKRRMEKCKKNVRLFAMHYFPLYATCEPASHHTEMANNIRHNKKINQLNIVHRDGAKSVWANLIIPLWLMLCHDELKYMVLIGANEDLAKDLLHDVRLNLRDNPRIRQDYGCLVGNGDWSQAKFRATTGDRFKAMGIDQPARGLRNAQYRPRYVSVDDVDDRDKARNQELTIKKVERILGDIMKGMDKDYKRLVYSNNFIHKKGVTAHLLQRIANKPRTRITWRDAVVRDPSRNKYLKELVDDPRVNITWRDPAAREGDSNWSARFSRQYWAEEKENDTPTIWERECMNHPVEEGMRFKSEWIKWKEMSPESWRDTYKHMVGYGDLSYKKRGDYKAMPLIGITHDLREWHVVVPFCDQTTLGDVAEHVYETNKTMIPGSEKELAYDTMRWYFEGSFAMDEFESDFDEYAIENSEVLIEVEADKDRKGDKYERIDTLTTPFKKGRWFFNSLYRNSSHMEETIDQLLFFEKGGGYPDDAPDAMKSAETKIKELIRDGESQGLSIGKFVKSVKRKFL